MQQALGRMFSFISLVKQSAKSDISDLFGKKKQVHFFFLLLH